MARTEEWTATRIIEVTRGGNRFDITDAVAALDDENKRLRAAIEEHKRGNTNLGLTNLRLWEALDEPHHH